MKNLTIAIDGHASTGKSSIAKELAVKYGYIYVNSGSMYRAVTLFAIENNLLKLTKTNINLFIDKLKEIGQAIGDKEKEWFKTAKKKLIDLKSKRHPN